MTIAEEKLQDDIDKLQADYDANELEIEGKFRKLTIFYNTLYYIKFKF